MPHSYIVGYYGENNKQKPLKICKAVKCFN